jgi:hypothetical protein
MVLETLQMLKQAGHLWLIPAILSTQEAEIKRITVRSQPKRIGCETHLKKKIHHTKKGCQSGSQCRP